MQDLLSDDDVTGLIMIGVMFAIIACLMYERYTTYKNLYRFFFLQPPSCIFSFSLSLCPSVDPSFGFSVFSFV